MVDVAKTVLIVHDNADERAEARRTLQAEGFRVTDHGCGETALAALRDNPRDIGVILVDLTTPTLNGWQFRATQAADPALRHIPTVVVTIMSLTQADRCVLGVEDYLRIPVDPVHLLGIVGRYVKPETSD